MTTSLMLTMFLAVQPVGTPPTPVDPPVDRIDRPSIERALGPLVQSSWQQEMEAATAKKKSGKNKVLLGSIGVVGGTLVATLAANDCINDTLNSAINGRVETCGSNAMVYSIGGLAVAGGAVMAIWGGVQWSDANGQISALNARKPGLPTPNFDVAVGPGTLRLSAGTTKALRYSVSW